MKNKNAIPVVHRITIDERLSEDLVRLEICELVKVAEKGEFKDEPDFWKVIVKDGGEILARPINSAKISVKNSYAKLMSIPDSKVKKFPWKDLKEGQVFLSGAFVVKKKQRGGKKVKQFFVSHGKAGFERIDDDVKESTKALYYDILAKGEKHVKL